MATSNTVVKKDREIWVDNVKILACVLVVMGHFLQSMAKSDIIERTQVYEWFQQTIYYFHVPLFFICSGYLYQKVSKVNNLASWKDNIAKKALNLGVPFFVFTLATYIMKSVFASSVNTENTGLIDSLIFNPISPYWFLYALFFLFLITPTAKSVKGAGNILIIALTLKVAGIILEGRVNLPFFLEKILGYEIWFVLGISLCVLKTNNILDTLKKRQTLTTSIVGGIVFTVITIVIYKLNLTGVPNGIASFICGLLACACVVGFFYGADINNRFLRMFAKYTMPIFLMHTIFAAGFRSVLFKLGISGKITHIILGTVVSFAGPVIAAYIMEKTKYLEIFLYPTKIIKINKNINEK